MDHIVYIDTLSKELESLLDNSKDIIIRGATGRKLPYNRVFVGDTLYFTRNNAEGFVSCKATVSNSIFTDKMTTEESTALYDLYSDRIKLNIKASKRFRGKRYLSIIEIKNTRSISAFKFDRSDYGNMDDWLAVGDINSVKKDD